MIAGTLCVWCGRLADRWLWGQAVCHECAAELEAKEETA